jgi:Primase C terminal 2 (PriCT-2)
MKGPHHIDNHIIHVTVFDDAAATDRTTHAHERTLPQIRDMILRTNAPTKAQLPWLKLGRFGRVRTSRGSLRHNANVLCISGVEVDFDGEDMSLADAKAKLKKLKCRALAYTSPRHTKHRPRWRILFPTSRELWEPDIRRVLVGRVDGYFGHIFDEASFTLSQSFYFGAALDNPNPDHRVAIVDGAFIDLRPDLERFDVVTKRIVGSQRQHQVPASTAAYDPEILAMEEADSGRGVSTDPDDYYPDDPDPELKIRAALAVIPSDDYDVWYRIGAAIHDALGDAGYEVFDEWSQTSSKYNEHECIEKWDRCQTISTIRVETIFWYADQYDPGWRRWFKNLMEVSP